MCVVLFEWRKRGDSVGFQKRTFEKARGVTAGISIKEETSAMVKNSKTESTNSVEEVKDLKHVNGSAALKSSSSPRLGSMKGRHQRSATLDNAFLMDERRSLDHSDVEERLSLPSIDDLTDDETPALVEEGIPAELLDILANPSIEDNTPAAEALRANAEIKVRKVGKLARRVHGQSVRRVVKRATLRSKSGRVRGKPPRIPPARASADAIPITGPDNEIYVVHEESEEIGEDELDSSIESSEQDAEYKHDHDDEAMFAAAAGGAGLASDDDEVVTEEDLVDKVPDWQTRLTEGPDSVPVEVLTATMETGKKGKWPLAAASLSFWVDDFISPHFHFAASPYDSVGKR